jgi:pimeloyl-ACP methyl ester carboxylesterase
MPTAAINGVQVSYADSGGDGPAVVLSHGYLMDASTFDAQVASGRPSLAACPRAGSTEAEANRPGYEQLHQLWLDQGPGPVQETVAAIILGPGQWDDWYAKWAAQYTQWAPANLSQLTWPFRCLMDRDDITARLGEVSCPALVVHGSQDAAIPLARAEQMRDALAGPTTFAVIDGAPHASNLTHPGPVNAEIVNFLHRLPG